jgi:hypothetical protein
MMDTLKQMRSVAHGAARSLLRLNGHEPRACDVNKAFEVLDDLTRSEPDTLAARWYMTESRNQEKLFVSEWRNYQKKGVQR